MMIKQIKHTDGESDLLIAVLKKDHRTILHYTNYFNKNFTYYNLNSYMLYNSGNFYKFTFINKGDIDERTTRD